MVAWKLWTSVPHVALWEAVALVLGIEPSQLRHSPHGWMAGPGGGPMLEERSFPSRERHEAFQRALGFAERAANYSGPIHLRIGLAAGMNKRTAQVSLAEVVAFFVSCDWPDIPAPLLALVESDADIPEPPQSKQLPAADPMPAVNGAKKWTPERLEELRTYRKAHGTKAAAEWARISEARVRELLPGDKPAPNGYSAFTQRRK